MQSVAQRFVVICSSQEKSIFRVQNYRFLLVFDITT